MHSHARNDYASRARSGRGLLATNAWRQMKLRKVLLSVILPLCLLIHSAAQTVPSSDVSAQNTAADEILLPAPTGPSRVGRASFHRVDTSRPEPFTADATDHREVFFHIWYPAEPSGGTLAPYVDNLLPDNEIFRASYTFAAIERVMKTRPHAFVGVKVSRAEKRYPVIVFSHGLNRVSA